MTIEAGTIQIVTFAGRQYCVRWVWQGNGEIGPLVAMRVATKNGETWRTLNGAYRPDVMRQVIALAKEVMASRYRS